MNLLELPSMQKNLNTLTIFVITCLLGHSSFAQEDAQAVAKEAEAPAELPGLEIDGRVFAESSAYAGTYSLIDSEAIELSGINDVEDLSGAVPGLHVTDTNGRSFGNVYTLRGIGNTPLFGTSGVVFYLDDVPQGDPSSINPALTDLNSIRVYRGPQGHLFGRNSSAGVVSMYSRKPGDARETQVDLTIGEYNTREYSIFTAAPMENGASYSFSLVHSERDGFVNNTTLGKHEDDRDHTGGRFNLYFKANDVIDVNVGIAVDKFDDGAQGFIGIVHPVTGLRNNNYFTNAANLAGSIKINRDQEWIKLTRKFDSGTLTSVTSRLNWELDPNVQDLDFMSLDFSAFGGMDHNMFSTIIQTQKTLTQEFRFEADTEGPLSWKAGLFYLDGEVNGTGTREFPIVFLSMRETQTTTHTIDEENLGAFASFEYAYNERTNLFGGLRWDRTEKTMNRSKTNILIASPADISLDKTDTQVTPSIGLTYDLNENTKWFAKSAIGHKPGGYSAYSDATTISYEDEKTWTTEIGVTLQPNDTLRMVLTAFWSEIEDYQFEKTFPLSLTNPLGTDYGIVNAEEVKGKGFEAEVVMQASENLILSGAFGLNDMTFEDHGAYNDNRVPFAPRYTLNLAAQYNAPGGYFGRMESRSVGDTYYDEENSTVMHQENYNVFNASIGMERNGFTIQVFGHNLGDERYYSNIAAISKSGNLIGGMAGSPRIFGISLSKKF
ncbi:MAG: TonB-dependent receptor [Opitutae bacterium]|nr:TonB-dependent receptor [Opitutae bacterium]